MYYTFFQGVGVSTVGLKLFLTDFCCHFSHTIKLLGQLWIRLRRVAHETIHAIKNIPKRGAC